MDDARLMYVIMAALDTTESVVKKRDEDENWVFGVMVTRDEIQEAKRIIGERFTEGTPLAGSASVLEKVAAHALGVMESTVSMWREHDCVPREPLEKAVEVLRGTLWTPEETPEEETPDEEDEE